MSFKQLIMNGILPYFECRLPPPILLADATHPSGPPEQPTSAPSACPDASIKVNATKRMFSKINQKSFTFRLKKLLENIDAENEYFLFHIMLHIFILWFIRNVKLNCYVLYRYTIQYNINYITCFAL